MSDTPESPHPLQPRSGRGNEPGPAAWLGASELLDLEDTRLRLRVQSLTQLCKTPREKALALYGFVKRIPFAKPIKTRLHTAREVIDLDRGDSPDKGTLLVAMLRIAGIAARLRYVLLRGEVLRGLTTGMPAASRPILEAWIEDRWVATDTYIFDAAYMAAARHRLRAQDWEWGYCIHVNGAAIWDARTDSYVNGAAPAVDPMALDMLGVFDDPLAFVTSPVYREQHPRLTRAIHWNVIAPLMDRAIREVRAGPSNTPAPAARNPS